MLQGNGSIDKLYRHVSEAIPRRLATAMFAVCALLASFSISGCGQSTNSTIIDNKLDTFVDNADMLSPSDVIQGSAGKRFDQDQGPEPSVGVEWDRLPMKRSYVGKYIEPIDPGTDSLHLFWLTHGTIRDHRVDTSTAVAERESWDASLRLRIPPDAASSPYVWIRTSGDIGSIEMLSQAQADDERLEYDAGSLAFAAFVLAISVLSTLLFIFLRDRGHGWFALGMALLALWDLVVWGSAWELIWPKASVPFAPTSNILFFCFTFALVAFTCEFLKLCRRPRQLLLATTGVATAIATFFAVFAPNDPGWISDPSASVWALAVFVSMLTAGVRSWISGYRPASYYVIGMFFFSFLWTINSATLAGFLPEREIFYWLDEIGSAVLALAMLVAVADALLTSRREIIEAQVLKAEAQAELVESQANSIAKLETYNQAFSRFVPREFLREIGRPDILEVTLGDHAQREMTVLFSDIRSFTPLSESMTPEKTFAFVNDYLGYVGPIVRKHGGFVDKFIGDAIMALFDGPVDGGLDAAIELQREVQHFNQKRAHELEQPIAVGIGLHCGLLMLGTIGEAERLDTTVIAGTVNVASRIEGLTKIYHVGVLATHDIVCRVSDKAKYHVRSLGSVVPRGTTQSVTIYEILDANEPAALLRKLSGRDAWEKAISDLGEHRYRSAIERFQQIFEDDPSDLTAEYLMQHALELEAANA